MESTLTQDPPQMIALLVDYLRSHYRSGALTTFHANYTVAGLRRLCILSRSSSWRCSNIQKLFRPAWRLPRSWHLNLPPEFRAPVTLDLALAIAVWAYLHNPIRFCVAVLLQFHCILRPEEVRSIMLQNIMLYVEGQRIFPRVFGIVGVTKPKTRRMAVHSAAQHVLIEDEALAQFLRWLLSLVPANERGQPLLPVSAARHLQLFNAAFDLLGCARDWTPAGFRGGGATHHYLLHHDVEELRRRGRWTSVSTLDRYLQEGVLLHDQSSMPSIVSSIADLAGSILKSSNSPPPPHHHSST